MTDSYVIGSVVTILLAIVIYSFIPKLYASRAEVSDETETLDLLLGQSTWSELIKPDDFFAVNFYDPEVYSLTMKSLSFKREILDTYVPAAKCSYLDYLADDEKDALERYDELVSFYYNPKYGTITFQVKDKNPNVAASMVDTIIDHLDLFVNRKRADFINNNLEVARVLCSQADSAYKSASATLAHYSDSHFSACDSKVLSKIEEYKNEVEIRKKNFNDRRILCERLEGQINLHQNSFARVTDTFVPVKPHSPNLILYIISFLLIFLVLNTWRILYKRKNSFNKDFSFNIFSPWMLTVCIWGGSLLLFSLQKDLLYPLSEQFYYCLLLWIPIFCLASIITYLVLPTHKRMNDVSVDFNKLLFNILFVITLVITPLYLMKILNIVMMFDQDDMLYNIRMLSLFGDERHGFLSYAYVLNQALFITAIVQYPNVKKWQITFLFITNILSCISIMEKNGLFVLVVASLFVLYEKKYIKTRTILLTFVAVVIGFFFFNMSKEIKSDDNAEQMEFMEYFGIYLLSPSVAFGYVKEALTDQIGSNTFAMFYMLLDKLGIGNFEVHARMQDFIWVPLPTNVYTIFHPFFEDFSYNGVAMFAMIYGLGYGFVYRLYKDGNKFGFCFYAYLAEVLLMQFYHESLLQNLVLLTQITLILFLLNPNKYRLSL